MIPRILLQLPALVAALMLAGLACGDETTPAADPGPAASSPSFPTTQTPAASPPSNNPRAIPPHPPVASTPALEAPLPALRFSGAPALYVLRRISGESGVQFGIDLFTSSSSPGATGLDGRFVDLDLAPGTVGDALQQLYAKLGGFLYTGLDDGVYIRGVGLLPNDPLFHQKLIPAGRYAGNFTDLRSWFLRGPGIAVKTAQVPGTPVWKKVDFETTEPMSVVDFLMRYGKEVGSGWLLYRSSSPSAKQAGNRGVFAIQELGLLVVRKHGYQPNGTFNRNSLLGTMVDIAERTGTPICIVDWAHGPDVPLPSLGGNSGPHGGSSPAPEQLQAVFDDYASTSVPQPFRWEERNGVILMHSARYDHNAGVAGSMLSERLKAGSFSGSLGELARWINRNRQGPGKGDLLAGEMFANDPVATLEVEEGASIQDVLLAFAAETGSCWTLSRRTVAFDIQPGRHKESGVEGAFLFPLEFWHRNGLQGLKERKNPPAASVSGAAPPAVGSGSP